MIRYLPFKRLLSPFISLAVGIAGIFYRYRNIAPVIGLLSYAAGFERPQALKPLRRAWAHGAWARLYR